MVTDGDLATGTHVVLGTGQVGVPVARTLLERGADVRVVNRSGTAPDGIAGDVDAVAGDVSDPEVAREVCEGATVVYFCLNPPYAEWPNQFPPLLEGALDGAADADARFVMADNCYAYGPTEGPLTEDLPAAATGEKGRTRAEMADTVLDAHESGRVRATIGRASDFYGPGVTASIAGERFCPEILDGGTVNYLGDPDQPHTYTYVPDFARALVTLGASERALGEVWHVPNAETLTTREFVALAGEVAGTDPSVRATPAWLARLLGLAVSEVGELRETRYQRAEPFVVSHEKFADAFASEPTPHAEALDRTLSWYRSEY
ncbi:NAD-dependent epimerase/dehydratase family protein [Halosimplex litoreum]|uniref:NAD-dependent epimerase/dehydratase family protein n=1 Tax=Halosimplex litoreum TaxID=1198301 RepID=A0A7T3FWI7_9EURY|nr:NAD-dependent epimerase/dehydratase family protein [Halosimplex litoreum]QPV62065.1 NAD-dependent epimerase/dehydratase family protein [Halosimplex litoreum]